MSKFEAYFDDSYKKALIERINTEPVIFKYAREMREREEKLIRESMHPFRAWLAERTRWKWVLRSFRVVETVQNEKWLYQVYKGKKLLNEAEFELGPAIKFRRFNE